MTQGRIFYRKPLDPWHVALCVVSILLAVTVSPWWLLLGWARINRGVVSLP